MELKTKAKIIDISGLISILLLTFNITIAFFSAFSEKFVFEANKTIPFYYIDAELILMIFCFGVFVFYEDGWKSWREINGFN